MNFFFTHLIFCSFALLFSSCVIQETTEVPIQGPSRTLVFYMGGDNNLSVELSDKLYAIQRFAANSDWVDREELNILIYQDSPSGAKLYQARFGQNSPELVSEYGKESSASPAVFNRILNDCIRIAPAHSYGLAVFSHATGWLPAKMFNTQSSATSRSIIVDNGDEMDIKDFAAAIPANTFDYVIFEACYMASVEVAFELREKVQYILASPTEILSPGFTDIYAKMLVKLGCPQVDTPTSLRNAAQVYFDHYNSKSGISRSATVSLIRTSELDKLAQLYRSVSSQLVGNDPRSVQHFDRNANGVHLFYDLGDYLARYAPNVLPELGVLLGRTVLFNASTPDFLLSEGGFKIAANCGLSIYIEQSKFVDINLEYQKLEWSKYLQK